MDGLGNVKNMIVAPRFGIGFILRKESIRLRLLTALVFIGFAVEAQVSAPIGILRGELIEWQGSAADGDLSVRTLENQVYSCHFDSHTYLERDNQRLGFGGVKTGDKVEVVADRKPGTVRCYARTLRVMDNKPGVANPGYRVNLRTFRPTTEFLFPRGNMTFSGVILRLTPAMRVPRTGGDGEKTILLRQDTRYMDSGLLSKFEGPPANTRVFVRSGKNLENE